MADAIVIKIDDAAVKEALNDLGRRMANPSPVMKIIGEYMIRSTEERFNRQGPAPDGTPWAPLKPGTLRRKKHSKILTESGALRGGIHYQLLGRNGVRIGTGMNIPYAAIQQLGGTIDQAARTATLAFKNRGGGFLSRKAASKRKTAVRVATASYGARKITIPARAYLGISDQDSGVIVGMINDYLAMR